MESPLQMSVAGGVTRDFLGTSAAWSQMQMTYDAGPWHWSAALRASASVSEPGMTPTFMVKPGMTVLGSAGVARDVGPTRVGVEYAFENGALGSRSAVMPWIALVRLNRSTMVRLGASIPVTGGGAVTTTLSVAGQF